MNLNKLNLFKPFGYLTLGCLAIAFTSAIALAQTSHIQPIVTAQLPENQEDERTRLIQAADALSNEEKHTEAEEILRRLIKRSPKYAIAHYKLGNVLYRQDKFAEAIVAYQQAIEINSRYALAHNAIGMVLARQNRWQEAIAEYQKALKINPEYGEALTHLGQALWQQGRRDEALATLEKALSIFKSQNRLDQAYRIEQLLQKLKSDEDPSVA